MKYTPEQAEKFKNKGFKKEDWTPTVIIKDGYYIVESKINFEYSIIIL
jgi:hypothetical protein